jgi:hypothetical protein
MKIRFGSTWLASGNVESAAGVAINGTQINDEQQFYRALAAVFRARGGRSITLTFYVTRRFDTLREAQRFSFEHFDQLPQQESLYYYLGTDADSEIVRFDGAVIDGCSAVPSGCTAQVQYSFRAGRPNYDSPPPSYTEPDADMIKRDVVTIDSGDDEVVVTFSVPFSGTPVIVTTMQIPAGGDRITAEVVDGTVSSSGFTAKLSAVTPGVGYKLSWIASA